MTQLRSVVKEPSDELLCVEDVSKTFVGGVSVVGRLLQAHQPRVAAVAGVSLAVRAGETLAVVGESGCGKSTLARVIVGLVEPTKGQVRFRGRQLAGTVARRTREDRRRVQMVFQDPYSSLNPRLTAGGLICEPMMEHGLAPDRRAAILKTHALLESVGLSAADADRFPHQFSGGQRQRISIARALASEPEFIVWDEPTSALDVSVQAQILNLIRRLQRQHGLTYVFISHNLGVVHNIADRVAVMYCGRVVELGPTAEVLTRPTHPYSRMLIEAVPRIGRPRRTRVAVPGELPNPLNPPTGCSFHPRCPLAHDRCRRERPLLAPARLNGHVACFEADAKRTEEGPP